MTKGKWILLGCLMLIPLLIRKLLSNLGIQLNSEAAFWLLLTIIAFFIIAIAIPKEYRKYVRWFAILFLLLTFTANFCKKDTPDTKNSGNSVPITSQKPVVAQNLSVVTKTDWGKLVRFTGREPDGVQLYETTQKGDLFKIALIGEPGIVDNRAGKIWPIWGADKFDLRWKKYFLYESKDIKPNAIIVMFGRPGTAKMEHVCTFDKGETEILIESPEDGLPLYLYYHEPIVEGSFYCFKNNRGYTTLQITKSPD